MRRANEAILRTRHVTPTLDDIIHDLNGATVISKLDMLSGYPQLELEPASSYITTFATHVGFYRYRRLNFGISSASEIFQDTIRQVLTDIRAAVNISDDIIIYGKDQASHDLALRAVIARLIDSELTLNKEKCELNKRRLEFFGHIFSADGVSVDPKRINQINNCCYDSCKTIPDMCA